MKSGKRTIILGILLAFFPFAPILFYVGPISVLGGCIVNEGNVNPCVLFGFDFGESLYDLGMLGWLSLITFPAGFLVILFGLIRVIYEKQNN